MGSTSIIYSAEEIAAMPLKKRPISHRISNEMYMAVWKHVGAASMAWRPLPPRETCDAEACSQVAVELCFEIANEIEQRVREALLNVAEIQKNQRVPMLDRTYSDYVDKCLIMRDEMRQTILDEAEKFA